MLRAEALLRRAEAWVFAPEDARRLAAVRIGLCGLLALRLALTDYDTVAHEPGLFQPHFYMRLFEGMPSPAVAASLQLCGVVAALTAAAGIALQLSLAVAVGCSLVLNGMLNSAGRVIVGDAVLTLCLLVLLAAGSAAGEAWSLRDPVRRTLRAPGLAVGPQTRRAPNEVPDLASAGPHAEPTGLSATSRHTSGQLAEMNSLYVYGERAFLDRRRKS